MTTARRKTLVELIFTGTKDELAQRLLEIHEQTKVKDKETKTEDGLMALLKIELAHGDLKNEDRYIEFAVALIQRMREFDVLTLKGDQLHMKEQLNVVPITDQERKEQQLEGPSWVAREDRPALILTNIMGYLPFIVYPNQKEYRDREKDLTEKMLAGLKAADRRKEPTISSAMLIDLVQVWKKAVLPEILNESKESKGPVTPQSSFHFEVPPQVFFVKDLRTQTQAMRYGDLPTVPLRPEEQKIHDQTLANLRANSKVNDALYVMFDTNLTKGYMNLSRQSGIPIMTIGKNALIIYGKQEKWKATRVDFSLLSAKERRDVQSLEKEERLIGNKNISSALMTILKRGHTPNFYNGKQMLLTGALYDTVNNILYLEAVRVDYVFLVAVENMKKIKAPGSMLHDKNFFKTGALAPFISKDRKVTIITRNDRWKLHSVASGFLECDNDNHSLTSLIERTAYKEADEEFALGRDGRRRISFCGQPTIASLSFREAVDLGMAPTIEFVVPLQAEQDCAYILSIMNSNEASHAHEHVTGSAENVSVAANERPEASTFMRRGYPGTFLYAPVLHACAVVENQGQTIASQITGIPHGRFYSVGMFSQSVPRLLQDHTQIEIEEELRCEMSLSRI